MSTLVTWVARLLLPGFGLTALATPGCSSATDEETAASDATELSSATDATPSDPRATAATKALFASLADYGAGGARKKILFGQQEADVANTSHYGTTPLRSDVEQLTGRMPALVSYELSSIYMGSTTMFDPEAFRRGAPALRELIRDKHAKGIRVALVWHMRCPKAYPGDSDRYAPSSCPADYTMEELLETTQHGARGRHFDEWRAILDELAELLWSLKDDAGQLIPVQVRPFHELTGDWFWWGRSNYPAVYQKVWREMVSYLRDRRGLHNVLWVFCPDKPTDRWQLESGGDFEKYFPGDAFVDVVGFDRYDDDSGSFARGYEDDLAKVGSFARVHHKLAAVTEIGRDMKRLGTRPGSKWFTQSMLAPLTRGEGREFSYVALWRNAPWEKYMPEPGDGDIAADFKAMTTRGVALAGD